MTTAEELAYIRAELKRFQGGSHSSLADCVDRLAAIMQRQEEERWNEEAEAAWYDVNGTEE